LEHIDAIRRYQHRYENSERGQDTERAYRISHYAEIRERQRRYYYSEHGQNIHRAARLQRSIRQRDIPGTLTSKQIQQKLKAQRYRCYYGACGHAKFKKRNGKYVFHLEHTIPLSRPDASPRHDINYIVLACPSCNLRKYNKLPHEWSEGGRLF
jgi:5-methylcytosine-specific restriction endonuclease McrA